MLLCWLLCAGVCALPVRGFLLGSCPRKDPPPGVVVLHPGSSVVLSCSGWVMVDGVRVNVTTREGSPATPTTHHNNVTATGESPATPATQRSDVTATGESPATPATQRSERSLFPTVTHTVDDNTGVTGTLHAADQTVRDEKLEQHQTRPPSDEYDWTAGDDDDDDDDHDEHEEEKGEAQWRKNGRLVTGGGGAGGGGGARVQFGRLALTAVAVTDTGAYTCHRHGHNFSVKIHVAGPPEQPILQCYKRSPSNKIRCDWTPQQPVSAHTSCSLLLYKGREGTPSRTECSYSWRLSRWWCAAEHTDDEHRTTHRAVLCVSSLTGSRLSPVLEFSPLGILKPDPPSAVSVTQVEGQERRLQVAWGPPLSWKRQDNFYSLQYELMYRPLQSTLEDTVVQIGGETVYWQILKKNVCYSITDALPGEEYVVQVRAKEEYDGHWSDWSPVLYAHTWTAQTSNTDDLPITMYPEFYPESEGSGIPEAVFNGGEQSDRTKVVWYHVLLAASSCVVLLVALAAYTIRRVGLVQPCFFHKPSSSTFSATASRPQGPMFPPRYKHTLPGEEKQQRGEEEEEEVTEETKVLHFDNSSYFLLHI